GTIDIHALRHFRANAKWGNWMKDLTTEQYRLIYDQPIYPKNLYAERSPYKHAEYHKEVLERQRELLRERGVYADQDAGSIEPEPACPKRAAQREATGMSRHHARTDEELLVLARNDADAFAELYDRHAGALAEWLARRSPPDAAQELLAETFAR